MAKSGYTIKKKKISGLLLTLLWMQVSTLAQNDQLLIPFRQVNSWGYCDTAGNMKIPLQYDSACFFNYNGKFPSAQVFKNRNTGIIDQQGKSIIPLEFDWIYNYGVLKTGEHLYITDSGFKKGLWIDNKKILPCIYDKIGMESENIFLVTLNKKRGLFNAEGREVIPPEYDEIRIWKKENNRVFYEAFRDGNKFIFRDTLPDTGEKELWLGAVEESLPYPDQFSWDSLKQAHPGLKLGDYLDAGVFVTEENGMKGCWINGAKKNLLPRFDEIKFAVAVGPAAQKKYNAAWLIAVVTNGKYGLINENGTFIYPALFDRMINRRDSVILLEKQNKTGAALLSSPLKDIDCRYEDMELAAEKGFLVFRVSKNKRTGYVGENGKEYFID